MDEKSENRPAKNIFNPENNEELLQGWCIHAHKERNRHDLAARRFDQARLWLGGTACVFSAIVGTSVFSVFEKESSPGVAVKAVIVSLSILSAILTSLNTFLNLAERAEKHRSAGAQYKEMIWKIERIQSKTKEPFVLEIEERLKDIQSTAPVVPNGIRSKVEKEFEKIEFVHKADDIYRSNN